MIYFTILILHFFVYVCLHLCIFFSLIHLYNYVCHVPCSQVSDIIFFIGFFSTT